MAFFIFDQKLRSLTAHTCRGELKHWQRVHHIDLNSREGVKGPAIVISGGGMCDGGPIQYYFSRLLCKPSTTVLMTGYAGENTVAGKLLHLPPHELRDQKSGMLGLKQNDIALASIRASIISLKGYSGHADESGLLDWLFNAGYYSEPAAKKRVFITHGNTKRRKALSLAIRKRAIEDNVSLPTELPNEESAWFDLDNDTWDTSDRSEAEILRAENEKLRREIEEMKRTS